MGSTNDRSFIDKTFIVIADLLLKVLPVTEKEKKSFSYYRSGMAAYSSGQFATALENYFEALKLEEEPTDRSFILYNIGLVYAKNGECRNALSYYHQALNFNSRLPQAYNNIAVIYHYQGTVAWRSKNVTLATSSFLRAGSYWKKATKLAPNNYLAASNWLKITGLN